MGRGDCRAHSMRPDRFRRRGDCRAPIRCRAMHLEATGRCTSRRQGDAAGRCRCDAGVMPVRVRKEARDQKTGAGMWVSSFTGRCSDPALAAIVAPIPAHPGPSRRCRAGAAPVPRRCRAIRFAIGWATVRWAPDCRGLRPMGRAACVRIAPTNDGNRVTRVVVLRIHGNQPCGCVAQPHARPDRRSVRPRFRWGGRGAAGRAGGETSLCETGCNFLVRPLRWPQSLVQTRHAPQARVTADNHTRAHLTHPTPPSAHIPPTRCLHPLIDSCRDDR
jgi:hypothetical protein